MRKIDNLRIQSRALIGTNVGMAKSVSSLHSTITPKLTRSNTNSKTAFVMKMSNKKEREREGKKHNERVYIYILSRIYIFSCACAQDNSESALSSGSLLQIRGLRQLSCPLARPELPFLSRYSPVGLFAPYRGIYALAARPNAQLYPPPPPC